MQNICNPERDYMIKNCLLPMMECVYGEKGKHIPEINYMVSLFPYSNEKILCVKDGVDNIDEIKSNFNRPLISRKNSKIYTIEPRNDVEQFSNKKQLVVGAVIHDTNKILFLEAFNQKTIYREHNYTMVLGHVNVDIINPVYTPHEIFRINLAKELIEELSHKYLSSDELYKYILTNENVAYIGTFTSNEIPVSNKHILIAYDILVDDVNDFMSNEPHKHAVHTININELHTIYERLDSFFLKSLSHIPMIKDRYYIALKDLHVDNLT